MSDIQKFIPTTIGINDTGLQNLLVITVISNPVRYRSRYELYRKFAEQMNQSGAKLITVEMAFGKRPFVITDSDNPMHVQLRSIDEMWHKENLGCIGLNYALQLFPDAEYCAFIDADVAPMCPMREWLEETVQSLQHWEVVQMFEKAVDLGPKGPMTNSPPMHSFMYKYVSSGCVKPVRGGFWEDAYYMEHGHPGYAWAYNINTLDYIGGPIGGPFIDFAILGAGDRHMALGLVGCIEQSFEHLNDEYRRALLQWQVSADRWVKRDVGYVDRDIYHYWHGPKRARGYTDRWKILRDNKFDPLLDIRRTSQGLLRLETWDDRQIRLRDQLRAYFRSRSEDDIRVD